MLELRPNCEHCGVALPAGSLDARICSFECTFCAHCSERVLKNVCPNCGGGFCPRPVRPTVAWRGEASLDKYPASTLIKHKPVDLASHGQLMALLEEIPPQDR